MKTYRLGDRLTRAEAEACGVERDSIAHHLWGQGLKDGKYVAAIKTTEFRAPKAGEWYLSGAEPLAYRAPNDLTTPFRIMRLAVVERRTVVTETVGLPVRFER